MVTKCSNPASGWPGPGFGSSLWWSIIIHSPPKQSKAFKGLPASSNRSVIFVANGLPWPHITAHVGGSPAPGSPQFRLTALTYLGNGDFDAQ